MPPSTAQRRIPQLLQSVYHDFLDAASHLDLSLSPLRTLTKYRSRKYTWAKIVERTFLTALVTLWLYLMPSFSLKILIPTAWLTVLAIPFTNQFFAPAAPILIWVMSWSCSQYIPIKYRPRISVTLLPTLEFVLFGGNISDILTRYTHPVLDVLAWLPYGVIHFVGPFLIAAALWLWRGNVGNKRNEALKFWATSFGYMNLAGVIFQNVFPCAPPWYELIYGLAPANYSIHGSAGGLARIDALFYSKSYTVGFAASPLVFGAFPSLHSGSATMEALVVSHFFPRLRRYVWCYAAVLYWATMYLTQHYLVDVVGGTCLGVLAFYYFLPHSLRTPNDNPSPFASTRAK